MVSSSYTTSQSERVVKRLSATIVRVVPFGALTVTLRKPRLFENSPPSSRMASALDADVESSVSRKQRRGGVLALYLQLGGVDVIELDPVAAAVDIEGALDVHILQVTVPTDPIAADKGLVGDGHRAGVDVAVLVDLGLAVGALLRKTRAVQLRCSSGWACRRWAVPAALRRSPDRLAADRLINRCRVLWELLPAKEGAGVSLCSEVLEVFERCLSCCCRGAARCG